MLRYLYFPPRHASGSCRADFPARRPRRLDRRFQRPAHAILLRPHISQTDIGGARISTRCPSPTPFGLGLGPDSPWEDEPCPGNLGFSMVKILTSLSLLIPAFSLPFRPRLLTVALQPTAARSPTTRIKNTHP